MAVEGVFIQMREDGYSANKNIPFLNLRHRRGIREEYHRIEEKKRAKGESGGV